MSSEVKIEKNRAWVITIFLFGKSFRNSDTECWDAPNWTPNGTILTYLLLRHQTCKGVSWWRNNHRLETSNMLLVQRYPCGGIVMPQYISLTIFSSKITRQWQALTLMGRGRVTRARYCRTSHHVSSSTLSQSLDFYEMPGRIVGLFFKGE